MNSNAVITPLAPNVQSRLRDCELGYATSTVMRAHSGMEVGRFVTGRMEDLNQLAAQVEAFMLKPAFMAVFGSRCDASTADADGIVHVANRLMDYHERFLELAERFLDFAAPSQYTDLRARHRRRRPVVLHMHVDDRLLQRISKQVRVAAKPH
jgi:hypothetical protein